MRLDERGQMHIHFMFFFGTLIMGAILYILFEPLSQTLLGTAADYTSTQEAARGQDYVAWTLASMHWLVIGFGVLYLLVAAVYESEVSVGR